MTTEDRFQALKRTLLGALELPAVQREAWVARACAGDEELRAEVEAKLARLGDDASVLLTGGVDELVRAARGDETMLPDDERTVASRERTLAAAEPRRPGAAPDVLAGYRILGKLGEGGMGVVYLAEQQSPRRRVALKVIRGGHFVDDLRVKMFQREVETLGRLKHPNIAAIYESGRTNDGQHFFAMELVQGATLDEHLRSRNADRTEPGEVELRLRLFRKIADAVHYAHQRGVIHRDLKPSNVIVTEETAEGSGTSRSAGPEVKVLDFGLARITDSDVQATTMSEVGAIKGTLPYMSPEQTRGNPDEIDVRTDVYSLGVILYEMLTDSQPYDTGGASLVQALRVICEESPRSMRSSFTGRKGLDPDVETIVLKALEKDADRRYPTASALADDVARYLASEPIVARPPSTVYQLRKFASRNKALVGGVAATIASLAVGLAISVTQYFQAESQRRAAEEARDEANAVTAFLAETLGSVDPERFGQAMRTTLEERAAGSGDSARGRALEASLADVNLTDASQFLLHTQVLRRAAERIGEELGDRPLVAARLEHTLAETYWRLGLWDPAEEHALRAIALREETLGPDHAATASAMHSLADVYRRSGRYAEAESLLVRAVEIRRRALGPDDEETLRSIILLADTIRYQGRAEEAEPLLRDALTRLRRVLGDDDDATLIAMNDLGIALHVLGKLDESEALFREAVERRRRKLGGVDNAENGITMTNLADVLREMDRPEEAGQLLERSVEVMSREQGQEHTMTLGSLMSLGIHRGSVGDWDEAQSIYLRIVEVGDRAGDRMASTARYNLACVAALNGRPTEAVEWLRDAVEHGAIAMRGDTPYMALDSDLDSLHGLPEFEAIVEEVRRRNREPPAASATAPR